MYDGFWWERDSYTFDIPTILTFFCEDFIFEGDFNISHLFCFTGNELYSPHSRLDPGCVFAQGLPSSAMGQLLGHLFAQPKGSEVSIDRAAIISLEKGANLTNPKAPNSIKIALREGQNLAYAMKTGDFSSLQANGVFVEGVKYQFIR